MTILCLVLTFAQPLLSRLSIGGSDLETIFIWDVSLSTTMLDEESVPISESLRQSLLEEIDALPDQSRVRILLVGAELRWMRDEGLELTEVNRQALKKAIRRQAIDQGGSQLAPAILTALSQNDSDSAKTRQLVVLHDSRRQAWRDEEESLWKTVQQRLAGDPDLLLRVLPLKAAYNPDPRQLSVNDLKSDRDTIALNTSGRFRASLKNHSSSKSLRAVVVWRIDDREVARSSMMLIPPQTEQKLEEFLRFKTPGSHRVECEIEFQGDAFPADNSASMVVEVLDGLPVLIVDDTVRTQRGQILPSEFLSASLGNLTEAKEKVRGKKGMNSRLFDSEMIASEQLNSTALEGQLAVVIAKADSLPGDSARLLRRFVEGGGGLWIMMDTTKKKIPEWVTALLAELGLEALSKSTRVTVENVDSPMKIIASDPEGSFAKGMVADRLDLFRSELRVVHDLQRRAYLDQERLLETDQGNPVLLSLGVGAGKVILQTTDLDRSNTNFPLLQSFVPFVREVIRESIQGWLPRRNLDPGEPIQVPLLGVQNSGGSEFLKGPNGSRLKMVQRGNWYEMADTLQSGVYEQLPNCSGSTQDVMDLFSVSRPSSESDLTFISAKEIASLVNSPDAPESLGSQGIRKGGWPLAWHFAILTGLFFVAESLMAHVIAKGLEAASEGVELKPIF